MSVEQPQIIPERGPEKIEKARVLEMLRAHGPEHPETNALVMRWTEEQEALVAAENTSRAAIVFNIERADLYVATGDIGGAADCLDDASTQAIQEDEMELLEQISDKMGQLIQEENKQMEDESEAEEFEKNVGHQRMKYEDERAYIDARVDLLKLGVELGGDSIFTKKEHGDSLDALAHLVVELKDQIPHYDTILSDDASGRLIALLLREIIQKKRDGQKTEPLQTYFIAGGIRQERVIEKTNEFIAEHKEKFGKTLLVTEYIETGESATLLIEALEKEGIDFDVATVSITNFINKYDKKIQKHLYYGVVGQEGLNFYKKTEATGVFKPTGKRPREMQSPHPVPARFYGAVNIGESVSQARKDVKIVAEELGKLVDAPKKDLSTG